MKLYEMAYEVSQFCMQLKVVFIIFKRYFTSKIVTVANYGRGKSIKYMFVWKYHEVSYKIKAK